MWSGRKSISLSKFCVLVFAVMLIGTVLSAPWLIRWFRPDLAGKKALFLSTIYSGSIPAAILLYCLYRLLRHIELEQVFITTNVEYLRRISWCCFAGSVICFASIPYYFPWCFVGRFMGLTSAIYSQAVELKNESELTIKGGRICPIAIM